MLRNLNFDSEQSFGKNWDYVKQEYKIVMTKLIKETISKYPEMIKGIIDGIKLDVPKFKLDNYTVLTLDNNDILIEYVIEDYREDSFIIEETDKYYHIYKACSRQRSKRILKICKNSKFHSFDSQKYEDLEHLENVLHLFTKKYKI